MFAHPASNRFTGIGPKPGPAVAYGHHDDGPGVGQQHRPTVDRTQRDSHPKPSYGFVNTLARLMDKTSLGTPRYLAGHDFDEAMDHDARYFATSAECPSKTRVDSW